MAIRDDADDSDDDEDGVDDDDDEKVPSSLGYYQDSVKC